LGPDLLKAKEKLQELCDQEEFMEKDFVELPLQPAIQDEKPKTALEWDFAFDWNKSPTISEIKELIKKLDTCLSQTKAKYTINTVENPYNPPRPEASLKLPPSVDTPFSVTYFKFYGPPIFEAMVKLETIMQDNPDIVKRDLLADEQHGVRLGVFDYAIVWQGIPTSSTIEQLVIEVDKGLADMGIFYSMQTKYYSEED